MLNRLGSSLIFMAMLVLAMPIGFAAEKASPVTSSPMNQWKLPPVAFPASNPYSEIKSNLGKQLFFDPRLNKNHLSCADCHHPGLNLSDSIPLARVNRHAMSRHTPSLINVAYAPIFFWDGRGTSLEAAIGDHLDGASEPGSVAETEAIVRSFQGYRQAFFLAFGNSNINARDILYALATFVRTLTITNTAFDKWIAGDKTSISDSAKRGFDIFTGKAGCVKCHTPPYFSDYKFHRTGSNSIDPGRFEVTGNPADENSFRTPPLRQVAETAPYMHAGQKATLREVIQFYASGGNQDGASGNKVAVQLSAQETEDILAFLKSLSGPSLTLAIPDLPVE